MSNPIKNNTPTTKTKDTTPVTISYPILYSSDEDKSLVGK